MNKVNKETIWVKNETNFAHTNSLFDELLESCQNNKFEYKIIDNDTTITVPLINETLFDDFCHFCFTNS